MKEIVNISLQGNFYCNGKDIMFDGSDGAIRKLAALIGSRIIRDGTLQIILSEERLIKGRSKKA